MYEVRAAGRVDGNFEIGLFGLPCFAIASVIAYVRAFLHRVLSSSYLLS
jgi:hypothetical protein